MMLVFVVCILLSIPVSYEQQLKIDAVSDAPSVQGSSTEVISDSPILTSLYGPFNTSEILLTEDPLLVPDAPSVQENQGSSTKVISDSPILTNLYGPFNTSETLLTEDPRTPTIQENSVTSPKSAHNPHSVFGNEEYDINIANETKVLGSVGNETYVKSRKPVLRKCCEFGRELTKFGCVVTPNGSLPFEPIVYHSVPHVLGINETEAVNETFDIVFGDVCQHGRYRLEPLMEPTDEFYLLDNGSLWLPAIETTVPGANEFCMESFIGEEGYDDVVVLPLVCFPPSEPIVNDEDLKWILYPAGMLLSVPFLLIILFAHIFIPKLHGTIQGKCLMCHAIALTLAYIGLATIQLSRSILPFDICVFIAFAVQFFFIACFAWLNVLCFDVWRRLRTMPSNYAQTKSARKKIMVLYSMYATAFPVFIIIVSMVMDLTPSIPASYIKPQFGVASCWFLTDDAALPYFYGPIGLMILANLILFVLTVINIHKHKRDDINATSGNKQVELVRTLTNLKRNIRLCFTLFILMGISWTMEIISWHSGNQGRIFRSFWYVTDVINSLQGVFIFIIYVLDGRFRQVVKERFKECWLEPDDLNDGHSDNQPEESILLPNLHSNHSP